MAGEVVGEDSVFRNEHQDTQPSVATPDYIYDPEDWEVTYEWSDRALLADNNELHWRANREPVRFKTLVHGPDVWAANIVLEWDDEGLEALEEEIRWFDSEDEAKAAIAKALPQTVAGDDATTPNTDPHPNQTAVP